MVHDEHGRGWVWGSGRGVVTVRFETRESPAGPVRSFSVDDPALHRWQPVTEDDETDDGGSDPGAPEVSGPG